MEPQKWNLVMFSPFWFPGSEWFIVSAKASLLTRTPAPVEPLLWVAARWKPAPCHPSLSGSYESLHWTLLTHTSFPREGIATVKQLCTSHSLWNDVKSQTNVRKFLSEFLLEKQHLFCKEGVYFQSVDICWKLYPAPNYSRCVGTASLKQDPSVFLWRFNIHLK